VAHHTTRRPVVLLAALIPTALLLGACSSDDATPRSTPLELTALHAEPDVQNGGRIVDGRGREVLLRGVNVNALAEYWKGTDFPTTFPLVDGDPTRMQSIGWSAVRLLVSWSRIEPAPGRYDENYLDDVERTVAQLKQAGLYSIVDFHQDAWGPETAARPDEICDPNTERGLGWDGAPEWATLDAGLPRCTAGARELNPATMRAWQAFFADEAAADGIGIQTRYVAMLGHVARRFAGAPEVAGYDLMNEPNAFSPADNERLSAMYGRAVEAMRAAERAGQGFAHLIFFEPSALFSATGSGAPPPFTADTNVVYAPHIYTGGFTDGPITRAAFETTRREAAGLGGVPVLSGEWGGEPERAKDPDDRYFLDHQRLQDEFRAHATLWTWRESCGDPHKVADFRAGRIPTVWGEFDVDCRDNSVGGARDALIAQLRRGYVRAAPGMLTETSWDHDRGRLDASGQAGDGDGELIAFHPAAASRELTVTVHGLESPRFLAVKGGGVLITATPKGGRWSILATRVPAPAD
jgi:endoglycosylceramidase